MKKTPALFCLPLFGLALFTGARWIDEGMWLLDSISRLPLGEMKKHGLELTPEQIYSPTGPSLKDAIVLMGGGTSSFVSAGGLMVTNHHVALGGIQALSSVQDDYLKNGFWARNRGEELPTSYTAQIVLSVKDVTAEVLSAVNDTMPAEIRAKTIRVKSAEIEKAAMVNTDHVCRISDLYSGMKYYLSTYRTFNDVRLVYAPPGAIGNFGGEVDNWTWPRHTGDFALMRVYTGPDGKPAKFSRDNIPFLPRVFLPISIQGYTEGSFAMILGFPGRTFRYREASAVAVARDETLPTTIELYKTRIDIITAFGKKDRAVEIKFASRLRGLANTYKNFLGTLEGMKREDLLLRKREEEKKFSAYINSSPELMSKYGSLLGDMEALSAELKTFSRKGLFLTSLVTGVDGLRLASKLRTFARSFRDSLGVSLPPSQKDRDATREFIGSVFKNFDLDIDKETLCAMILKDSEMPPDCQLATLREIAGSRAGASREKKTREFVEDLYEESTLTTPAGCAKMIGGTAGEITEDPFVQFASKIEEEQGPVTESMAKYTATITPLRARFIEAWLGWKKGDVVYPDANRTIRFTYGTVKAYSPRDGVDYRYFSTLRGVMEKENGNDPFDVPQKLHELWTKHDFGRYADAKTGELHVAFLTDLDITGGNSGSPVINGRGEFIGSSFDSNWEGIVGDYHFDPQFNRTISVDARYMLFLIDRFSGAENIMMELVIR